MSSPYPHVDVRPTATPQLSLKTVASQEQKLCSDHLSSGKTLESYGPTIEHFTSAHELLFALRDAVLGHQDLLRDSTFHQDISIDNILIGHQGSKFGKRGVLIVLETARSPNPKGRMGTRAFQSFHVLNAQSPMQAVHPRDYLDDLESFLYVLCWVCFGHLSPGRRVYPPSALAPWDSPTPRTAASDKYVFLFGSHSFLLERHLSPFFGKTFVTLISSLCTLVQRVVSIKQRIGLLPPNARKAELSKLLSQPQKHYSEFVGRIEQAIDSLGEEPNNKVETECRREAKTLGGDAKSVDASQSAVKSNCIARAHGASSHNNKRRVEEDVAEDAPTMRRQRTRSNMRLKDNGKNKAL